jgi:cytochrome P450
MIRRLRHSVRRERFHPIQCRLPGLLERLCAQEHDMPTQQELSYDPTNPYPWYRYMRETHPVHYNEQNKMWYAYRYEDVQRILLNAQTFGSSGAHGDTYLEASFLHMDPPRHGRYRTLVSQAFTPNSVALLEPRISTIVNDLLDAVAHTGRMDLIADLAFPLPAMIIMELFGVPAESREHFRKLSESIIQEIEDNPGGGMFPSETKLAELLFPVIEARRSQPGDDLISRLLAAEAEGEKLATRDILATCILMLIAGHETTTRLIGNAMWCFTERPEVMAELRSNPALIPGALEEVLRYRAPLGGTLRVATSDVLIGATSIKAGEAILLQISSTHHDDAVFSDPEVFDIRRTPNRHLGFGQGIHFCMGAPLARMEGRVAIQSLLQRFPDLQQTGELPVRLTLGAAGLFQGTKQLPIAFTPEAR